MGNPICLKDNSKESPGQEVNLQTEPDFCDADKGEFHLNSESPAINEGIWHSYVPSVDYEGERRFHALSVEVP
jgi:hypothetical protein